jgi:catechol-2,3-dioxygenase
VPAEYDHEPDVPISFYHFAFEAESPSALIDKRDELRANGVNVTDIVDHQWSKSIHFKDPNGLSLDYCCAARSRTEEDAMPAPFTASHARRTGSDACFDQSQQHTQ